MVVLVTKLTLKTAELLFLLLLMIMKMSHRLDNSILDNFWTKYSLMMMMRAEEMCEER